MVSSHGLLAQQQQSVKIVCSDPLFVVFNEPTACLFVGLLIFKKVILFFKKATNKQAAASLMRLRRAEVKSKELEWVWREEWRE